MSARSLATAGALAASLLVPSFADAQSEAETPLSQEVPFTTVASRATEGGRDVRELVIEHEGVYRVFFNGSPPAGPRVDFGREVVLVACHGETRTGTRTEITKVVQDVRGTAAGSIFIHLSEVREAGVPAGPTQPFHAVKIPRTRGTRYFFRRNWPDTPGFTDIEHSSESGPVRQAARLTLKADGAARLERTSAGNAAPAVDGFATPGELEAVRSAFAKCDVTTLPAAIDPRATRVVSVGAVVTIRSRLGPRVHEVTAYVDHYKDDKGDYTERLAPLAAALERIARRLSTAGGAERRELTGDVVFVGGKPMISEDKSDVFEVANAPFVDMFKSAAGRWVRAFGRVKKTHALGGTVEVEWVEGSARRETPELPLWRRYLKQGETFKITGIQKRTGGFYYRALINDGTAVMLDPPDVRIGKHFAPAPATPGVVGVVPR